MSGHEQGDGGGKTEDRQQNPIISAWESLKSDIDTKRVQEVVDIKNGRPKIDPQKAKELAKEKNRWSIRGATGGAIVGALISISGVLTIPLAAAGAAVGYIVDKNAVNNVEKIEEDFKEVLDAIEDEEEVDLSQLAMITHIKKETLSDEYLPYLEDLGFVAVDEENEEVRYSEPVIQQAVSYVRG